jgi:hypothetical protein
MEKKISTNRKRFIKNRYLFYFILFGLLCLKTNLSYSQSNIVLYDNLTNRGAPGSNPLFMGNGNRIGVLVGTGNSDVNLKSLVLGLWNSQSNPTSYTVNFALDIFSVTTSGDNSTITVSDTPLYTMPNNVTYVDNNYDSSLLTFLL